MNFYSFRLLSDVAQLYWVSRHGTFLATRFENGGAVNLYHCTNEGRGFFAEVGYDQHRSRVVVLRSFVASGPLAKYGNGLRLLAWQA